MSTVAEIESALEQLPTEQMLAVAAWLDKRRAMLGLDLDGAEREQLREALDDFLARRHEAFTPLDSKTRRRTIGDALLEFAGMAEDLPSDVARNHDHYLHGAPRRES